MPATFAVPAEFARLRDRFATLTDPRCARGKVHPLPGELGLVVLGLLRLLGGRRSLSALSRYGAIPAAVRAPLGPRRSPSVATLHLSLDSSSGKFRSG